jgi:hypothetical protein
MTVSNDGITGQGSALPGAKFVFPGFEVALRCRVISSEFGKPLRLRVVSNNE